jgi:hypothetical protein
MKEKGAQRPILRINESLKKKECAQRGQTHYEHRNKEIVDTVSIQFIATDSNDIYIISYISYI